MLKELDLFLTEYKLTHTTQWRRHTDQIVESQVPMKFPSIEIAESNTLKSTYPDQDGKSVVPDSSMSKAVDQAEEPTVANQPKSVLISPKPTVEKRYPVRTRKPKILQGFVYGSSIKTKP